MNAPLNARKAWKTLKQTLGITSFFLVLLLPLPDLFAKTGGNLYQILMDADQRPLRLVYVCSLQEKDALPFLLETLGFENPRVQLSGKTRIVVERKSRGDIPVLCFHRIGNDDRYELSLPRVHALMATLKDNHYFPISDSDFASGDFSAVPSGLKPVVLGADDAAATQLLWDSETLKAYQAGFPPTSWTLDPNCLASIYTRYFSKDRGQFNLTFYISFDAVPFRQLAGQKNTGPPYRDIAIVGDKLRYAHDHFHIAYHGLSHSFRKTMNTEAFIREIEVSSRIISGYLQKSVFLPTMSWPYGSGDFTPGEEQEFKRAIAEGRFPGMAFDLNGQFSPPPWSRDFQALDINRFSVDNANYSLLVNKLLAGENYVSRRIVLIPSESKNLDWNDYNPGLAGDDTVYVYIP